MFLTSCFSLNFITHAGLGYQLTHTRTNKEEELLQPLECELGMLFDLEFDAEETDFTSALLTQCCCFAVRLAFFTLTEDSYCHTAVSVH